MKVYTTENFSQLVEFTKRLNTAHSTLVDAIGVLTERQQFKV